MDRFSTLRQFNNCVEEEISPDSSDFVEEGASTAFPEISSSTPVLRKGAPVPSRGGEKGKSSRVKIALLQGNRGQFFTSPGVLPAYAGGGGAANCFVDLPGLGKI